MLVSMLLHVSFNSCCSLILLILHIVAPDDLSAAIYPGAQVTPLPPPSCTLITRWLTDAYRPKQTYSYVYKFVQPCVACLYAYIYGSIMRQSPDGCPGVPRPCPVRPPLRWPHEARCGAGAGGPGGGAVHPWPGEERQASVRTFVPPTCPRGGLKRW